MSNILNPTIEEYTCTVGTNRMVVYCVDGLDGWFASSSNATTFKQLKADLRGEPGIPRNYAIFVKSGRDWGTEKLFDGKLPDGRLEVRVLPCNRRIQCFSRRRAVYCQFL
jgi:hypothetical protein